jgi:hypothetical protein
VSKGGIPATAAAAAALSGSWLTVHYIQMAPNEEKWSLLIISNDKFVLDFCFDSVVCLTD